MCLLWVGCWVCYLLSVSYSFRWLLSVLRQLSKLLSECITHDQTVSIPTFCKALSLWVDFCGRCQQKLYSFRALEFLLKNLLFYSLPPPLLSSFPASRATRVPRQALWICCNPFRHNYEFNFVSTPHYVSCCFTTVIERVPSGVTMYIPFVCVWRQQRAWERAFFGISWL